MKFLNRKWVLRVLLFVLIFSLGISGFLYFTRPSITRQAADTFLGFNEGYGGTASDTNSTVSAGTITNALWRVEDLCKTGKCLYFDGTGDYVSYADSASLDMAATDTVTVEGWFRTPDITSGTRTLISKEEATGADGGYRIQMNSSGQIVFGIDNNNTSYPLYGITSASAYDDNNWHHVAAVKNGTASISLYIDANSVGSISIASTAADNDDPFYIGTYFDVSASNGWSGFIDEVKVLRTARTSTEIKADYVGETPSRGTSASFGPDQSYLSNGLVGYWKMDEASGDASDSSGNGLTLTNNSSTSFAAGKFANAGSFVAASTDYFSTATTINSVQTVAFWVNPSATTDEFVNLTSSAYITASSGIVTGTGFTGPEVYVNGAKNTAISASTWSHVVITSTAGINANAFEIGRANSAYTNGSIDDVRLYNRALSPAEVGQLYSWAPGPVGYWKLDENTGTTSVVDSSGNGNTATMNGSMTNDAWVPGKFGSALNFDGTDDSVSIATANDASFDFAGTEIFSGSAWVYIKSMPGSGEQDAIITKWDTTSTLRGYRLIVENDDADATGNFQVDLYDESADQTITATGANDTVSANTWYHVAFTFNGGVAGTAEDLILYTNGVYIDGNNLNASFLGLEDVAVDVGIGNYDATDVVSTNTPLSGITDDVRVYNYARTPGQITEDLNAGHPAPGSPVGSPLAYWKFDEGSNVTAYDSSGNSRNLGLNSGTGCIGTSCHYDSGKFNKAYSPLGAYEAVITNSAFSFGSGSFALSTWVSSTSASNPASNEFIITRGTYSGNGGYALYFDTSGRINFAIDDDATWNPDDVITSPADVYDAAWHHIVAIKTTNTQMDLYVDGLRVASKTSLTASGSLDGNNNLIVADRDAIDNGDEFNGYIDETSVYNSALIVDQVNLLYNQGKSAVFGSISTTSSGVPDNTSERDMCIPGDTSSCAGPVGEWLMNENTGTTAYDTRASGQVTQINDGTLTNMDTATAWNQGKRGSAVKFDGVNDVIVTNDLSNKIDGVTAVTFSAWVRFTTLANSSAIVAKAQNANVNRTIMQSGSAANGGSDDVLLTVDPDNDGVVDACYTTGNFVTTDVWQHWTMVYDGSQSATGCARLKFYLNGISQPLTLVTSAVTPATNPATSTAVIIGAEFSAGTNPAAATIDEVRIYDYARTPAQIQWEYNRGKPVSYYKFDDCTGTLAKDASIGGNDTANGNDATITIGAGGEDTVGDCSTSSTAWGNGATGKFNYSLDLDGTDDQAVTGSFSPLSAAGQTTTKVSWGGWFYPKTSAASKTLIEKATEFRLTTDSNSKPICDIYTSSAFTTNAAVNSSALTLNAWNHILCVYDGTNITAYINGARADTWAQTGTITAASSALHIGQNSSSAQRFEGQVDDIKLWSYNLTANQVLTEFNQSGVARFGPLTGSP